MGVIWLKIFTHSKKFTKMEVIRYLPAIWVCGQWGAGGLRDVVLLLVWLGALASLPMPLHLKGQLARHGITMAAIALCLAWMNTGKRRMHKEDLLLRLQTMRK